MIKSNDNSEQKHQTLTGSSFCDLKMCWFFIFSVINHHNEILLGFGQWFPLMLIMTMIQWLCDCVNLIQSFLRPHTLRPELGCVSTWWIVSHCRHCVVLLAARCCFKLWPACWLRPGCGVVSACVVLFQAQCGAVERIVLSSRGYCPGLICVYALIHVTGQFVRTATVSRYETSSFPQSFTSDLSSCAWRPD